MDGIILIDKPAGLSSFDVIKKCKKYFDTPKVGHCGTLDPFATGLLIIGINQATKALPYIMDEYKEYIATIRFGKHYDTYDNTGTIVKEKGFVSYDDNKLKEVIDSFKGEITQIPPKYSALKVNGRCLYDYARNNEEVEIKSRKVFIYDLVVLEHHDDSLTIYVKCSKGTYIRSLGVDIANKLDNLGYLERLRRISVGKLNVNQANSIKDFDDSKILLHRISDILDYRKHEISKDMLKAIYNGNNIKLDYDDETIIITYLNEALAIYIKEDDHYKCTRGLFDETTRYKEIL